jgi:hypothetical protein
MICLIILFFTAPQVHSTKIFLKEVIYSNNPKLANLTAAIGRDKNNDTYFNSTVETFEDLAKMMVR